ncbi:hypothetical protein N8878_00135 [Psychromonas sp.]|nr:hypothetical protein [Psychromonas sp.]
MSEKFPVNSKIECHKSISSYQMVEVIQVDLVEMITSNGHSYLYSY